MGTVSNQPTDNGLERPMMRRFSRRLATGIGCAVGSPFLEELVVELERQYQEALMQERKRQRLEAWSAALERMRRKPEEATEVIALPACKPEAQIEVDGRWREVIAHPSVVLILGKRGSGKSALGYRLLELCRYALTPYVLGLPKQGQKLLPDWIGTAQSLEDIPQKSIVLVDEAYLRYHARGSMAQESKAMTQFLNLSRQREQTLVFVSQEARQVDRNISSSASVVVFKDMGMLQIEFDRPELAKIATQAKQAIETIKGDRRRWSYLYSPNADFMGLLENDLPSFWTAKLSHAFAAGGESPATKPPKRMTLQERIQKALELHQGGLSLGQIAKMMGVSKGTAYNYVKGYPYKA
jgi:hypothetical protein